MPPAPLDCAVVIAAYNPELPVLRESLGRILENSPALIREVVVVDDGSAVPVAADAIAPAGDAGRLRLIRRRNGGCAAARNTGVAATSAPILIFIDSDCVPQPDWAERLTRPLRDGTAVATCGWTQGLDDHSLLSDYADFIGILGRPIRHRGRIANIFHVHSAILRSVYAKTGGFADVLRRTQDLDFTYRLLQAGYGDRLVEVPDAMVLHRHRNSLRDFVRQAYFSGQGAMAHCILRGRDPREIFVLRPTPAGAAYQAARTLLAPAVTFGRAIRKRGIGRAAVAFPVLTLLRMTYYNRGAYALWRRHRRTGQIVFS